MILEAHKITGGYKKGVNILRGINLTVEDGEAVGIIGLNGSGKSTLGKSLMNMLPFRNGEFLFNGKDISRLSVSEIAQNGICMMLQGGKVFDCLSVSDNLQLAGKANDELMDIIPLLRMDNGHRMADQLSGGQRHQLALAMTLLLRPRLLILDEPSAGLSPKAVDDMYKILTDVKQRLGVSIILIEQNISKAVSFCDRCLLMTQGQIDREFKNQDIKEIEEIMFNNIV